MQCKNQKENIYCRRKELVSILQKLRETSAHASSTLPKLEKPARKVGGEAAYFWCSFFECFFGARPEGIFQDFGAQRPSKWRPLGGHLEVFLGAL